MIDAPTTNAPTISATNTVPLTPKPPSITSAVTPVLRTWIPRPTTEGPHFREVSWGMSKNEVKKLESANLIAKNSESLSYSVKVQGKGATLHYYFDDADPLFRAAYVFQPDCFNYNVYVKDFNQLELAYKDKYGTPSVDTEESWSNSLFKGDEENLGNAIAMGYCDISSGWKLLDTNLVLNIRGSDFEVMIIALYQPRDIDPPKNDTSDI